MWHFLFQNLISGLGFLFPCQSGINPSSGWEPMEWVFCPICLSIATLWKPQFPHGYCSKLFTGLLYGLRPYRSFGSGVSSFCLPIASCSALGQACLHTVCICLWCSGVVRRSFQANMWRAFLVFCLECPSCPIFFTPCIVQVFTYYSDFRFPYEDFHFGGVSKRIQYFYSRVDWPLPNNSDPFLHELSQVSSNGWVYTIE